MSFQLISFHFFVPVLNKHFILTSHTRCWYYSLQRHEGWEGEVETLCSKVRFYLCFLSHPVLRPVLKMKARTSLDIGCTGHTGVQLWPVLCKNHHLN